MIPYHDLEKALSRWKARMAAPQGSHASGELGATKKKIPSSLDWSMDQAMGSTPNPVAPGDTGTGEIVAEEDLEAAAAPEAENTGHSTSEIDVNQVVEDEEPQQ